MKIAGREVAGKNRVSVVLPREGGDPIAFIAEAVSDLNRLDEYISLPEPPVVQKKGGVIEKNHDDQGYKEQLGQYNAKRMAWLILESLKPSQIEWDTVNEDDPGTWKNYMKDLQGAGFSDVEINLIVSAVLEANALDENKLNAAREVFLRGQAAAKDTSGPSTQAASSQSGKPASDSE